MCGAWLNVRAAEGRDTKRWGSWFDRWLRVGLWAGGGKISWWVNSVQSGLDKKISFGGTARNNAVQCGFCEVEVKPRNTRDTRKKGREHVGSAEGRGKMFVNMKRREKREINGLRSVKA